MIKKVKNTFPWTYVINDLIGEKVNGAFYDKQLKKTNQKEFRIEKLINSFNNWIDKKELVKMSQYFPKPYELFEGDIKLKVDFL